MSEISLLELTGAYAAIANGGFGVWPYGIQRIEDRDGRVLYVRSGSGPGRVIAAADAADLTDMLSEAIATGTGKAARMSRPAAGKTGTSQNARDAWFVGFTADLVAGVWMGNDDERPMASVTGGGRAGPAVEGVHDGGPVGHAGAAAAVREGRSRGRRRRLPAAALDRPTAEEPGFFERLLRVFSSG